MYKINWRRGWDSKRALFRDKEAVSTASSPKLSPNRIPIKGQTRATVPFTSALGGLPGFSTEPKCFGQLFIERQRPKSQGNSPEGLTKRVKLSLTYQ